MIERGEHTCFVHMPAGLILAVMLTMAHAEKPTVSVKPEIGVQWDFMQIVRSTNSRHDLPRDTTWLNGFWMQQIKSYLDVGAEVGGNLDIGVRYFGAIQFTLSTDITRKGQQRQGWGGMEKASATYYVRGRDAAGMAVAVGYFPFEYTYPWQRFGGYLFKTGVYPGYIISNLMQVRLTGLQASRAIPAWLHHDLFFTIERDQPPHDDLNVTYLARTAAGRAVEGSAGFMLYRLVRSDQSHFEYGFSRPQYTFVDPDTPGDTIAYRSAGIKFIGGLSIDIKRFFSSSRLGPNDLLLYTEAAVLGLVDFGGFYNDIKERVPVMAGLTLPGFRLLDVIGVECEWYGSRWKNNPSGLALPVPVQSFDPDPGGRTGWRFITDPSNDDAGRKARTDNVKWAVFAEKTIRNQLTLGLHVASDHLRAPASSAVGYADEELLHAPDEYYWQFTLITRF